MKNIFYISTILILSTIFWCVFAYANDNDCKLLVIDKNSAYVALENVKYKNAYKNVFSDEAIKQVFDNLRSFCCLQKDFTKYDNCTWVDTSRDFPYSAYLFDHMLDVYLRRLDAKQKDENWEDLIYSLTPDPKWQEWREYISNIWNSKDWYVPADIVAQYKKAWDSQEVFRSFSNDITNKSRGDWESHINNVLSKYPDLTLWDRYYWACNIITYLYLQLVDNIPEATLKNRYTNCNTLVEKRITAEKNYTDAVIQWKWTLLLEKNMSTYLETYLFDNKMASLQDLVIKIRTLFTEINKWIEKLVKECN